MKLREMFNVQKRLDTKILQEHNLEGHILINEKILALQVELGELANETRSFKYWSKKGPSPREVILEEYVDCLHFILSIGIEAGYFDVSIQERLPKDVMPLVPEFLKLFGSIATFQLEQTLENYEAIWENFLVLGSGIGFTWDEITEAYLIKNEINHQRQRDGY